MRVYPDETFINGVLYRYERILKEDFFSVNVLYRNDSGVRYVLKLSDFRFIFGFFLRPAAAFFSRREYRIYRMLEDIKGVPELGPRYGWRGYFHKFIEGRTLHEIPRKGPLPEDFFDNLKRIMEEVHKRRVFYLDLNKLGNIILGDDDLPYLIDFQVSLFFKKRSGPLGRLNDFLFTSLIREDIYHLYKHKKRFMRSAMTEEELLLAKRSRFNVWYDRIWGTPYRKVKRLIYPKGSNDIIWFKWKKMKDKKKHMP
jgi:hypothetical protein